MNAAGEILVGIRFVQGHSNIVHTIFDHIAAEIVKVSNGNNVIHNNSSFFHTIARREREGKKIERRRKMSEMEKAMAERLVEAARRVPEDQQNRAIGYMEGYADAMEAARREKDGLK